VQNWKLNYSAECCLPKSPNPIVSISDLDLSLFSTSQLFFYGLNIQILPIGVHHRMCFKTLNERWEYLYGAELKPWELGRPEFK
jgi:hypothetical protein